MRQKVGTHFWARCLGASLLLPAAAHAGTFTLTGPGLADGHRLPEAQVMNGFGCSGGNRSPELSWSAPPAGTKSLAVTMYDPDAPTGSGWWHWVVVDIPATVRHLPAGAGGGSGHGAHLPAGAVEARNDFRLPGFGGACPPPGKPHRYVFTVHALKFARLDVNADTSGMIAGALIQANSLAQASITAIYGR